MQLKPGDTVRYLNAVGGGRVTKIEGRMAYVDEDGFETPVLVSECVVVASGDSFYRSGKTPAPEPDAPEKKAPRQPAAPEPEIPEAVETAEGEKLNVVLAFEPADLRSLSTTSFDAFVVNDSNYWLDVTIATRPRQSDQWTLRFAGSIEPAMQIFAFELTNDMLSEVDHLSFRAIAYKKDRQFDLKPTVDYSRRLDATRLLKLHCFTSNPYFDSKVLAIDIVTDDRTASAPAMPDPAALSEAMRQKARADRPAHKQEHTKRPDGPLVVDLHASELLDTTAGMSAAEILNYQIDTFRRVMDENLDHPGREIVFIHGKGEGVLRAAVLKELNHRYKGHDVSDASFREYGFGATRVVIRRSR